MTECLFLTVISTGRRNTGDQPAINNSDGSPNVRPIAFSESLTQPAIPQRNFLCRSRTTTKSLTYRPIIDLFPSTIKCCVDRLSRHPKADIGSTP